MGPSQTLNRLLPLSLFMMSRARILQRDPSLSSQSLSPQYRNSFQQSRTSPQTRSPSPHIDDYTVHRWTGTYMHVDIIWISLTTQEMMVHPTSEGMLCFELIARDDKQDH